MATKKKMLQAAAGNAGGEALNVEDVFSTYLYEGNGSSQVIQNGINLGQSFGSGSVEFDGSSHLTSSTNIAASGDFIIEAWVYKNDAAKIQIFSSSSSSFNRQFAIDATQRLNIYDGTSELYSAGTIGLNAWHHVLVSRSGSTLYFFIDGVASGTSTTSATLYFGSVGSLWGQYDFWEGYLSDVRLVLGSSVTSAFTPPTEPLTAISGTAFLGLQTSDPFVDNSTNAYTITQSGTPEAATFGPFDAAEAGEGGMIWESKRDTAGAIKAVHDTENGVSVALYSNGDGVVNPAPYLSSFNSNGFTYNSGLSVSGENYVTWTFRKASKFFDVVTWTGSSGNRTIPHNLQATVGTIIVKETTTTGNWFVYHKDRPSTSDLLLLNTTGSYSDYNGATNFPTEPTSTDFYVDPNLNGLGTGYVAYLFAHNDGDGEFGPDGDADIIKCGSFTTDGSGNATVDLGFEPQWLLVKTSAAATNWFIVDNMRGLNMSNSATLNPNTSSAEDPANTWFKPSATGFETVGTYTSQPFIYIAIRRGTKVPESGTEVFALSEDTANGSYINTGFTVDMSIWNNKSGYSGNSVVNDRIRGVSSNSTYSGPELQTSSTNEEGAISQPTLGWDNTGLYATTGSTMYWLWKRAPNFFDVVAYTGDGVAGRTVSHNLGVAPEMMWVKSRTPTGYRWAVYSSALGSGDTNYLNLDTSNAENAFGPLSMWNSTDPTSSEFYLGDFITVNEASTDYIAYLFASLDGVSKVGSWTMTTGDNNIDCGFTSGARFVLIKDASATGNWLVWDSERGIVSGNDPYLELNTTSAEFTTLDYIDPLASGFTITSTYANFYAGNTYIFYAIA